MPQTQTHTTRGSIQGNILALVLALCASFLPAIALAQGANSYSARRSADVPVNGVTTIRIYNGSGMLVVEGKNDLPAVRVTGTARAASESLLTGIKLTAARDGDVVTIGPEYPGSGGWGWGNHCACSLDITVEVPRGVHLEVHAGSGGAQVNDVGPLNITAGSGAASVERVGGDVTAIAGSGGITIRHVNGSVNIERAGSGDVRLEDASGSADVGSIGSGSLTVDSLGGDLVVRRKGAGAVHYTAVRGRVDLPTRNSWIIW